MNKVYAILYNNTDVTKNNRPIRGVCTVVFTDLDQAMIQAAKLNQEFPEINHWVEVLRVEVG